MIGQQQFSNELAHHICPAIAFRRSSLLKSGFCFQHRTPAGHFPLPHGMHCVIHPCCAKKSTNYADIAVYLEIHQTTVERTRFSFTV